MVEGNQEAMMKKLLLSAVLAAATLGGVAVATAQPYAGPPPGWSGSHYYWHGRHYHNRSFVWDRGHHHRSWRYW